MSNKVLISFYENKYKKGEELTKTSKSITLDIVPEGRGRALDIGCATGLNSKQIRSKGYDITGVDLSAEAIAKYNEAGFQGLVMDIENGLDFDDNYFNLVFCSEVIEHLSVPDFLCSEISRVLKPSGALVLSTPNSAFWVYRLFAIFGRTLTEIQHPYHLRFFSYRGMLAMLKAHGLQPEIVTGRNMYLLLPHIWDGLDGVLQKLGFTKEIRFRTGKPFWHLSHGSSFWNSLFADTIVLIVRKE